MPGLPLLPHELFGTDCCGCINEIIEKEASRFVCNECGAFVFKEDVVRAVLE